jgi:hypothetical protein
LGPLKKKPGNREITACLGDGTRVATGAEVRNVILIPDQFVKSSNVIPNKLSPGRCLSLACGAGLMAAALPGSVSPAGAEEAGAAAPAPPPPQRFHLLNNFELSDKYLTPRGMIVHNDGLTFQWLALGLFNIYKGDGFLNDFTLVGGVWNDFCSDGVSKQPPFDSKPKTKWVEIDPIAGVSFGFARNFKLDVTYTAFNMQILDIGTSQHLETKVSYDDTSVLKGFALHPYFLYWRELDNKATAAQVPYIVDPLGKNPGPPPDSSFYFELGVAPGYTFKDWGLKLEAPCRVLLPGEDFYGEYYDDASTVGLYELGVKATLPLKFVPGGYGFWSFHVGFRYMNFVDENLQGMQQFNAPGRSTDDTVQYYCGLTAFF